MRSGVILCAALLVALAGCSYKDWSGPFYFDQPLTDGELQICRDLNLDPEVISDLKGRPIFTFEPRELDMYLRFARRLCPDLRDRIAHLGRKNIGQPYDIYLLGEFPHEIYDDEPTFNLEESDCVVFSEHTYAMALGYDWASFYRTLQQLRYMNGEVGIMTRNHWTLANWDVSNDWLIDDRTTELGGGDQWSTIHQTRRPSIFFMRRFGLGADMFDEEHEFTYIPLDNIENVLGELRTGDFVNIIRGSEEAGWAGHTGLITVDPDGTVNFLHSSPPRVREVPMREYINTIRNSNERNVDNPRYNPTIGMKFLSLRADVLEQQFAVPDEALVLPVPDPDFRRPGRTEEATPDWVQSESSSTPASQPTSQPTQ